MKIQVIEKDGRPEWAVIPYAEYRRLIDAAGAAEDVRDFDAIKAALGAGREELVPAGIADRLLDGENPVKVWREHRSLSSGRCLRAHAGCRIADRVRQEKSIG